MAAIPTGTIVGPVIEVYVVKKFDKYRLEVAIPSIAYLVNTSYVVISRETERFVNEIHDHQKKSSGPAANCSLTFRDQKEVNSMEKKRDPIASRKLVRAVPAHSHS